MSAETMLGSLRSRSSTGGWNALVDVDERERHAADLLASELQAGDVDPRLAEQRADGADDAGNVAVVAA